ncbi:S-adenosyl-L-methionine-dependent methyltransferase [Phycomyces blakesleeanus]|uniref:S-adenosyl-L-methionine-dependent methyltransferase n=1 Tax=Phycomyces blakesleeanus TaxID=4837 RepID=A0ABR3ANV0_PHYBL
MYVIFLGPATWTLDMAKAYDRSEFYGIDISPVFPEDIKPANTHFQLANITNRLPFPDNHFDFIHQRLLIFGLTRSDWTKAIDELLRVLKPGGWIEFKELELNLENTGTMTTKLKESMITMTTTRDMNPTIGRELRLLLIQRGLLNIQAKRISVPVNHDGKIGELFWDNYKQMSLALAPVISGSLPLDFPQFLDSCAKECAKEKTNWGWHVVYAQKPVSPIRFSH